MARSKPQARATFAHLYKTTNWTQKRIAEMVGVTQRTASKWVQEDELEAQRQARATSHFEMQQLSRDISIQWLQQKKQEILEGKGMDGGDIDALNKLANSLEKIGGRETLEMYISALEPFLDWLLTQDVALAKQVAPLTEKFLALKARQLNGSKR